MAKALTLATKYRPQGWDALVEQDDIKVVIQNQLKTSNIKHAYLFCGGARHREDNFSPYRSKFNK